MRSITFPNGSLDLAGDLHLPPEFDDAMRYPALVCIHPGNGVKEQTAGIYAARMATRGYVALAFDASGQGDSGGQPRGGEEPSARVEDIRCAVDYLTTLEFIDERRIGALGICAGAGFTINATMTDHRIAAVGVVSPINIGRARREGAGSTAALVRMLDEIGHRRTAQARSGHLATQPWLPDSRSSAEQAGITDMDTLEAIDYYQTPRGAHPNSTNELRTITVASVIAFDAFHLVEQLLTQPLQVIVGNRVGNFGSYRDGYELWRRAITSSKDLRIIDGASHYDLYDDPQYVAQAVEQLDGFFTRHLQSSPDAIEQAAA